jgi:hypothetical protein
MHARTPKRFEDKAHDGKRRSIGETITKNKSGVKRQGFTVEGQE